MRDQIFHTYLQFIRRDKDPVAACELLHNYFFSSLHKFARCFVKSGEAAAEVVSTVFFEIWESRHSLERMRNFRVYLYTATRDQCLNYLKQHDEQDISLTSFEDYEVTLVKFEPGSEELMITSGMMRRIQQAVDSLSPRCKLIFKMIREEGFRNREVAEILDIPVNAVDVQLAIAIRRIGQATRLQAGKSILAKGKYSGPQSN